ncbi:hypothetical protein cypCar_00033139, partial [Cyprinus carpio]
VVVRGRARGRGGGRVMMQQNPRAQDCQRSTVCIDGLSSTTTNKQLMNLLNSIGPVEKFTMLPEQRKAIAKFVNPQHAASFQHSFHRTELPGAQKGGFFIKQMLCTLFHSKMALVFKRTI